ncbi:MAG: hypothetical protein ABI717_07530 [Actinomycetota bacterium]
MRVPYEQLPVRPLTRIVALALVPFLVIGSTLLYVWPGETM